MAPRVIICEHDNGYVSLHACDLINMSFLFVDLLLSGLMLA